jgi:hypothetical protein
MNVVTVDEMGLAIAYHLRHYDKSTGVLPRSASTLIDVYGSMSFYDRGYVEWRKLTDEQADLIRQAIEAKYQLPLPMIGSEQ